MGQIRSQPNTYGYCFRSLCEAPPIPIVGHIDKTVDKIGIHTSREITRHPPMHQANDAPQFSIKRGGGGEATVCRAITTLRTQHWYEFLNLTSV